MTVYQVDFLMEEWDFERNNTEGLDPNILSAQSSKKAYWKGKCGHSWRQEFVIDILEENALFVQTKL